MLIKYWKNIEKYVVKSQPNFEYKNYIYGSIILFDYFGDDNCEIELINTSNAHDREIDN